MALVLPDIVSMRIDWRFKEVPYYNVLYYLASPFYNVDPFSAAQAARGVAEALSSSGVMDTITSLVTLDGVTMYDLRTVGGAQAFGPPPVAVTGNSDDTPMPLGACVCDTFYTAVNSRSYRGRAYFSGWVFDANGTDEAQYGRPNIDTLNANLFWRFLWEIFRDDTAITLDQVVVSRKHNDYQPVPLQSYIRRTTLRWCNQRRRNSRAA